MSCIGDIIRLTDVYVDSEASGRGYDQAFSKVRDVRSSTSALVPNRKRKWLYTRGACSA